ncbi:MAG: TetR/AcrR family transcriptional regulator [Pararhodobacter sp.]|nr:TetR/AcrR family transcriptional regulator [Pararhodobacter sp.]
MTRPKTISDENVLAAALEVLAESGDSFTLSDLAKRVGLSRATLIQRFGNREAILLRIATHEAEATQAWLESLPLDSSGNELWPFLEEIVGSMGRGDGFSARVTLAALEARDPALRALAHRRYTLVQSAIAARLPPGAERDRTAEHLHAIIAGATMQWVASDSDTGLSDHVLERLRWALNHLKSGLI